MGFEFCENSVIARGLPLIMRGCGTDPADGFVHIGMLFMRITACGRRMGNILMSDDMIINCPECVAEMKYRKEHPDAAKQDLSVVTHRRKT